MAQQTVSRPPRRSRVRNLKLALLVVEVPSVWQPASPLELPPAYAIVERAGLFEKQLARDLQKDFNNAELLARRAGRPRFLWMMVPPHGRSGGRYLWSVVERAKGGAA